ncbi:MAG: hypothetical protein M5Z89_18995 [Olivibacter sp.]|nr:hypothetical protein [Olivibacter sp. UJ_SKK_5.1]
MKEEISVTFFDPKDFPYAMDYAYACMSLFNLVKDSVEELYLSVVLFKEEKRIVEVVTSSTPAYPDYSTFKGYNSSTIVMYLIKNWINRYSSCIETCFNLIQQVCEINITGKNYPKNILERFQNKDCELYSLSVQLNNLLNTSLHLKNPATMREMNNQIKHYGKFSDPHLSELFLSNFLRFFPSKEKFEKEKVYDILSQRTHKLLLEILLEKSNELEYSIVKVLDELTREFEKRFEILKRSEKG